MTTMRLVVLLCCLLICHVLQQQQHQHVDALLLPVSTADASVDGDCPAVESTRNDNDNDNDNVKDEDEEDEDEVARPTFTVLVIGGGMSGLAAARYLLPSFNHQSALVGSRIQVDLLEAKADRLGGRLWTVPTTMTRTSGDGETNALDLGGMYWHGTDAPLFSQLHQELPKWKTAPTQGTSINPAKGGARWMWVGNSTVTDVDPHTVDQILPDLVQQWNTTMQQHVREYLKRNDNNGTPRNRQEEPALLSEWSEGFLGALPTLEQRRLVEFQLHMYFDFDLGLPFYQLSLEYFLNSFDWKDGPGDDHISLKGMQTLIHALADDVVARTGRIHLGQRATRIQYTDTVCRVETADGTIWEASACVVTIPLGVLQATHESLFDPPLEASKQDVLQRAGIGMLETIAIQWNIPICHPPNTTAYYMVHATFSTSNPLAQGFICSGLLRDGDPTITQFYVSEPKEVMDSRSHHYGGSKDEIEAFWKAHAVDVIQQTLVPDVQIDDILDIWYSSWREDPDIRGSYSAPATYTNGNVDRAILAKKSGPTLFFAGEHTNTHGRYQSIDGAYETGAQAAEAILVQMAQTIEK